MSLYVHFSEVLVACWEIAAYTAYDKLPDCLFSFSHFGVGF